jgi:ribonuclease HI
LLGVWLDAGFTFDEHVDRVAGAARRAMYVMRQLASAASAAKLRVLHQALVLERLLFSCEAWYPYASSAARQRLEDVHAEGCRLILGVARDTKRETVLREAGFRPFSQLALERCIKTHEKLRHCAHSSTPSDLGVSWLRAALFNAVSLPRAPLRAGDVPHVRLRAAAGQPPSLLELVDPLQRFTPLRNDAHLHGPGFSNAQLAALSRFVPRTALDCTPPDGLSKVDASAGQLARANERRVAALPHGAVMIFTDGSTRMYTACREGASVGAFLVVQDGRFLRFGAAPAGTLSCPYVAEHVGIAAGLRWFLRNRSLFARFVRVCVVTDSLSAMSAVATGPLRQRDALPRNVWTLLADLAMRNTYVSFHFVFSHVGTRGNDAVDGYANAMRAAIGSDKAELWRTDATRHRIAAANERHDALHQEAAPLPTARFELPRRDEMLLYQARTGAMPCIGGHVHGQRDPCPRCGEADALGRHGLALEHIFERCPYVHELRDAFAPAAGRRLVDVLWDEPQLAVEYLRRFAEAKARGAQPAGGAALAT